LVTWNCTANRDAATGNIIIIPSEKVITRVHINLKKNETVLIKFQNGENVNKVCVPGMQWVGPGGLPEILR
jgi:hypothetical protein